MSKRQRRGGGRTEEEKLLHLQHRARAEEELAKKKEDVLTLFLKDKLQKEQRNAADNLLKLSNSWRTTLRQTRAAELQKDISVLSQTRQRQLDGLDDVIKSLERELQEAERQAAQVHRLHLHNLERLWVQQDKQLAFLQQQWENSLQHLSSRFHSERKQTLATTQQRRDDLDNAEFIMEQQFEETMTEIHSLYDSSMTQHQLAPEATGKTQGTARDSALEKNQDLLLDQATAEADELVEKPAPARPAAESQSYILQMKRMKARRKEHEAVERDLTSARNEVIRKTRRLQDQLTRAAAAASQRLSDLTLHSSDATKQLQEVIDKGERVLRVANMCRKLEAKQETGFMSAAADHQSQERCVTEEEGEKERPAFPELQQLMRRVSAALLQREALKRQRTDLSRDNQQLRLLLRQHLDAMAVSEGARHSPLTVCRAPTSATPADTSRRHTVVEAAHAVKHSL